MAPMQASLVRPADPRFTLADHLVSWAIALGSFVVLFVNYWLPGEQIFDEVYFARAAHEYITRQYIYENTHPPITKLLITASTFVLGNTSVGWRILDVVSGAIAVWLLYALVRRMTGSTLCASFASLLFAADGMHFVQSRIATPESFVVTFALALIYTLYRYVQAVRETPDEEGALPLLPFIGGLAAIAAASAIFVALRFPAESWPAKIVAFLWLFAGGYAFWRYRFTSAANAWMLGVALCIGLCVGSKWYTVMSCVLAIGVVAYVSPRAFARNAALIAFVAGSMYTLAYLPQYFGLADQPTSAPRPYTWTDVFNMQISAYEYHHNLNATHPYSSVWWMWPLDLRPVFYYAHYGEGAQAHTSTDIYSLPNPLILWPGLLAVPYVAWLAWSERRAAYALLVLVYVAQLLPWALSPRIAFAYHFYVDIPIICACLAIAMRRIPWRPVAWCYLAAVLVAFVFFYPILAGLTIPDDAVRARQWLGHWWM